MKIILKWGLGVSLLFVLLYFVQLDDVIPDKVNYTYFLISLCLLILAFIADAFLWQKTISLGQTQPKFKSVLAATGLSVFGKYIPGKIWALLGRAAYISTDEPDAYINITYLSAYYQILVLFGGCSFSALFFLFTPSFTLLAAFGVLLTTSALLIFHIEWLRVHLQKMVKLVFKKRIDIPSFKITHTIKLLPLTYLPWLLWGTGFYFLALATYTDSPQYAFIFAFPLAAVAGILAIIAPGGIGVRESILTGLLVATGADYSSAAALAVISRAWFLIGEFSLFLLGLGAHYFIRRSK